MKCEIIKGWCEPCSVEAICCEEMLCDICSDREGEGVKCSHYWDATDIPGICICICGASRMYDRTRDRYVVTDWNEKEEENEYV